MNPVNFKLQTSTSKKDERMKMSAWLGLFVVFGG